VVPGSCPRCDTRGGHSHEGLLAAGVEGKTDWAGGHDDSPPQCVATTPLLMEIIGFWGEASYPDEGAGQLLGGISSPDARLVQHPPQAKTKKCAVGVGIVRTVG